MYNTPSLSTLHKCNKGAPRLSVRTVTFTQFFSSESWAKKQTTKPLTCRRDLTDRPRLANQHMQSRDTPFFRPPFTSDSSGTFPFAKLSRKRRVMLICTICSKHIKGLKNNCYLLWQNTTCGFSGQDPFSSYNITVKRWQMRCWTLNYQLLVELFCYVVWCPCCVCHNK